MCLSDLTISLMQDLAKTMSLVVLCLVLQLRRWSHHTLFSLRTYLAADSILCRACKSLFVALKERGVPCWLFSTSFQEIWCRY